VAEVVAAGYQAVPIPGPSALAAILSVSGLQIKRPLFVGFLPKKKGHQTLMKNLKSALSSEVTDALVFYESPERLVRFLMELEAWKIPLTLVIGRELTKMFEEIVRGTVQECFAYFSAKPSIKGEIVLIVH